MITLIQNKKKYKQLSYSRDEILDLFYNNYKVIFSDEAFWFDGKKPKGKTGIESFPHAIILTPALNTMFVLFVVIEDDFNENCSWEENFYKKLATFNSVFDNINVRNQLKEYFLDELNNSNNNINIDLKSIMENDLSLIILTNKKDVKLINAVKFLPYQDKHIFALKGFCNEELLFSQNITEPDILYFEN